MIIVTYSLFRSKDVLIICAIIHNNKYLIILLDNLCFYILIKSYYFIDIICNFPRVLNGEALWTHMTTHN